MEWKITPAEVGEMMEEISDTIRNFSLKRKKSKKIILEKKSNKKSQR